MADPAEDPTGVGSAYVRGSGAIDIDTRRLVRIVLVASVLILVVVAAATTVQAAGQNSTRNLLARHGVPVQMSVVSCIATGSGVGQGTSYYTCRGRYTLGGRTYLADIGGTRAAYPPGDTLSGVAVPGHPDVLATAASVAARKSAWTAYVTPLVLWAVTLVVGLVLIAWTRRGRSAAGRGAPAASR